MKRSQRKIQWMMSALLVCTLATGCSLWKLRNQEQSESRTWKEVFGTSGPEVVDAAVPSVETVVLEVAHLEQPLSDISMIDLVWKEVDVIGATDARTRKKLKENGLRVGIAGPNIPRTLAHMLEVDAVWREERSEGRQGSTAQSVVVFPGEPTHLHTGAVMPSCTIDVPRAKGREKLELKNVNCQFQIEAEQLQDNWVELHLIPEIHHDAESLRRVATEEGWQFQNSQKVLPVYDQKFTLTLNQGEVAVISASEFKPGTLGHAMFIGDGEDDQIQRMIVIRLSDIRSARAKLAREVQ
ncbi:MAG: hypothetical protein HUJ26_13560 [Planctomycetaceae bacterium]|nr:hypothetical protein [Planctomycetaceae bacterium]